MDCKRGTFSIVLAVTVVSLYLFIAINRKGLPSRSLQPLHRRWNHTKGTVCHSHVQLCWIRSVISTVSGLTLPEDLYDLSSLYKFKTHMFLDDPAFHKEVYKWISGTKLVARAKKLLEYFQYEWLLTGNNYTLLTLPRGVDINGRNCSYNPFDEYKYHYNAYQINGQIHIHVTEIRLQQTENNQQRMNNIFGSVKTRDTVKRCYLDDYFNNNTHHIVCDVLQKDFSITISAVYISITNHIFKCKPNDIRELRHYRSEYFPKHDVKILQSKASLSRSKQTKCASGRGHNTGHWLRIDSIFHWATKSCYYPLSFDKSTLKCLRKKKIHIFGDMDVIVQGH